MKNDAKEYRELAATFRGVADAADKVADVLEKNGTQEEQEAAAKEFMWEIVKLQIMNGE